MSTEVMARASCLGLLLSLAACASGGAGEECLGDDQCPIGRYCAAGSCIYDCTHDFQCVSGYRCDPGRGKCVQGCTRTNGGVEACDLADNDCDGLTDEPFTELGTPCQNASCPEGTWICAPDGLGTRCSGPEPAEDDASCDGLDDDCDGTTDEDAQPQPCPLQQGVCQGASVACAQGAYAACDYGPAYTEGRDEACNAQDNDCDGLTDEEALLLEPESGPQAADALDNNCNGLVDEPGGAMVPIPGHSGVWIDAFESTIFEAADCTGARYGQSADDYPAAWPPTGAASVSLYACSLPGLVPSGHLSFYRAERACQAQGKRLCEPMEWTWACTDEPLSKPYVYGPIFIGGRCNDPFTGPQQPSAAGQYPGCISSSAAADMSGNLAEWIDAQNPEPEYPDEAPAGGYHYLAEICWHGVGCRPALLTPQEPDYREVILGLDCNPSNRTYETFPRSTVLAYLGVRCCLDGP